MSAPTLKARPAPVMTRALTPASARRSSRAASISSIISKLMPLSAFGRFSVMVAIRSDLSSRIVL